MNQEVCTLFHELADLSPGDRERVLADRRIGPEVREELESLLSFDSTNFQGLTDCVADAAQQVLNSANGQEPDSCGPYRLVQRLGSGGMGAVYLGERSDGEMRQKVAVKLLRADAHRPEWRNRFLRERQLLASLNHPSIVHVIDAGHTADGRPFLVMEYVDGIPIDDFAAGIEVRERLALFLGVCAGVSHAHRHLIIHRDLKPSNILVDASGQPKVLDFGIGKLLDETADATQTVERLLTPSYASPEQLSGTIQTTATDVYSLGAVLYKLLTGRSPHEPEPGTARGTATSREVTRPSRWAPKLKGDLESILLKALREDPQQRYATVEQFADDLRAFLESRPVRARHANWWYRTRKFVRRYWMPMSAAAVVIVSLSTALYFVNRQRAVAEARVAQLHRVSRQLLEIEHQLAAPNAGSDLRLHHDLAATSIQYLESLGREDLRNKQLTLEIGDAYLRIARIQGVPEWNQQGRYSDAERSLSKVAELANSVLAADPANREALWLSANAAHDRAVIAYIERRPDQVFAYSPKAVEGFDRLARLGSLTRREINGATYIYGDLAEVHIGLHRFEDAVRYARLGIDYSRSITTVPGPRGQAFNMLAGALTYLGDLQGALQAASEARNLWDQLRHDEGDSYYTRLILYQTRCREGLLLGEDGGVNLNQPKEAALRLEEAFAALEGYAQTDRYNYEARAMIATGGHYLGDLLRRSNPKRALEVYDHSLVRVREVPNDVAARRIEALLLAGSSYAARAIHRDGDAKERIDAAFRLLRETGDYPNVAFQSGSEADVALQSLADHYAETGQPNQAIELYEGLRKHFEACNSCAERDLPAAADLSRIQASLAATLRNIGSREKAATVEAARADMWRLWNRRLSSNPFVLRQIAAAIPPQPAIH
jgi:tRNA A-37 threonylcarbamoyl transferase component Bud32